MEGKILKYLLTEIKVKLTLFYLLNTLQNIQKYNFEMDNSLAALKLNFGSTSA